MISVIIPTYNRGHYLSWAIDSVLSQSFTDFELIIVDDGSTDNTRHIVSKYGQGIKYIYQDHKGVSSARNRGIKAAGEQYVAFLDSDDRWMPQKLIEQLIFMQKNPEAKICYTDEVWIRKGVRVNPMKKHKKYSGDIFERSLPLCIVSPSSVLIKRELFSDIGMFDEAMPVCEDYDLWLRISLLYPFFFIDKRLIIKYGGHPDQLSNSIWGNDRYRVIAMEKILSHPALSDGKRVHLLKQLVKKCLILEKGYKKRGKKGYMVYHEKAKYYTSELEAIDETY